MSLLCGLPDCDVVVLIGFSLVSQWLDEESAELIISLHCSWFHKTAQFSRSKFGKTAYFLIKLILDITNLNIT